MSGVFRVLDEVLQKLVQLIQEEDCVSEETGTINTYDKKNILLNAAIGFGS